MHKGIYLEDIGGNRNRNALPNCTKLTHSVFIGPVAPLTTNSGTTRIESTSCLLRNYREGRPYVARRARRARKLASGGRLLIRARHRTRVHGKQRRPGHRCLCICSKHDLTTFPSSFSRFH